MKIHHVVITLALAATLSACSLGGSGDKEPRADTVVLVTHDSFALPDELIADFEKESGFNLKINASGDAGVVTNKLVQTKGNPTGDVAFGVDNTFASKAIDAGVFAPYLPAGNVADYDVPGDTDHRMTAIDTGNVCVNIDHTWFADQGIEPPSTLDDLTDQAYRDLFVLPGAASSSPGMAFLLTTIAAYGDSWPDYWTALLDNGAKLTSGWSDAYQVDFTQGGGSGKRPIVLSYDSSPAFTVKDGETSTTALLETCFQQVEYAGVLDGASNPTGAKALVDFLLTDKVQAALPDSMYVFPVAADTPLPDDWASFAPRPEQPFTVDPAQIAANRDDWLTEWSDVTAR